MAGVTTQMISGRGAGKSSTSGSAAMHAACEPRPSGKRRLASCIAGEPSIESPSL